MPIHSNRSYYLRWGKHLFDTLAAALLLLVLSPLMICLAFITWAFLGSPVLFRQERPGLAGRPFFIFKFRTMTNAVDTNGDLLSENDRITPVGRFLRRHSLDELPELFNVIRGDMSLVGPRPLLMRYLPRYTDRQARRHEVRPGITGLAQVHGRNAISWAEKFEFDIKYIEDVTFTGDIKILAITLVEVFRATGVNADEETTMPEFWGTAAPDSRDT